MAVFQPGPSGAAQPGPSGAAVSSMATTAAVDDDDGSASISSCPRKILQLLSRPALLSPSLSSVKRPIRRPSAVLLSPNLPRLPTTSPQRRKRANSSSPAVLEALHLPPLQLPSPVVSIADCDGDAETSKTCFFTTQSYQKWSLSHQSSTFQSQFQAFRKAQGRRLPKRKRLQKFMTRRSSAASNLTASTASVDGESAVPMLSTPLLQNLSKRQRDAGDGDGDGDGVRTVAAVVPAPADSRAPLTKQDHLDFVSLVSKLCQRKGNLRSLSKADRQRYESLNIRVLEEQKRFRERQENFICNKFSSVYMNLDSNLETALYMLYLQRRRRVGGLEPRQIRIASTSAATSTQEFVCVQTLQHEGHIAIVSLKNAVQLGSSKDIAAECLQQIVRNDCFGFHCFFLFLSSVLPSFCIRPPFTA